MKSDRYQRRFYRERASAQGLYARRITRKETDLEILTDRPLDSEFAEERIRLYRWDIENYINKDRRFLVALKPLAVELSAPPIIKEMAEAAEKAGVGPMAAVAGAVAQFLGRDLLKRGYKDVIVENGGDIFLKVTKSRTIGIYAGRQRAWNNLKLKIKPADTPLGVCASSGVIGHSLSFGCADTAVIMSKSASLADAVATATANRVNSRKDLAGALAFARSVKGVCGALIILKKDILSWGKVEFIR